MESVINKEQKTSIILLLTSKTFERLAFYLVMTILIQYLMESLNLEVNKAGIYYSVFYGIVGVTALFSGLLGDLRNRISVVKTGFILMILMYLAIALLPNIFYVITTALLILGFSIGLISPNIIVYLGNIFNEKENEVIGLPGFILFSVVINIGALIAPLFASFLKDNFGYNSVFLFASLFGSVALFFFLKFKNQYNELNVIVEQKSYLESTATKKLNTLILISILALGLLIRFALNQKGMVFTFAIRDFVKNGLELTQSLTDVENFISTFLLLVFALILSRIKPLNWGKIFNIIIIGLLFSIIAFVLIASITSFSQLINGKSIFIDSYILLIIAETLIFPTFLYLVYRSSPMKYKGFLQGISLFIIGVSNSLLYIGFALYEKNALMAFIGFALILVVAVIIILILKKTVNNKLTNLEGRNLNG